MPDPAVKIALIGTHGVGKTTLCYELCSLLKKAGEGVELVAEVAWRSPFPVNEATTLESQLWILHAQIAAELDAVSRAPWVICDRSVLDNYCYLVNRCGRKPELEQWLAEWVRSYALFVSVPPSNGEIPADGFRSENLVFQKRIHDLIGDLLAAPPFAIASGRVMRLDRRDRHRWGALIFSTATPLVSTGGRTQATAAW